MSAALLFVLLYLLIMKITKKNIILLLALMLTTLAHAQASIGEKAKKDLIQKTSFGGYVIGKATITDQDLDASTKSHTDFDIRLVRAYVDGKVLDFKYKLQLELNGKPGDYAKKVCALWMPGRNGKSTNSFMYASDNSNAPSPSRTP